MSGTTEGRSACSRTAHTGVMLKFVVELLREVIEGYPDTFKNRSHCALILLDEGLQDVKRQDFGMPELGSGVLGFGEGFLGFYG